MVSVDCVDGQAGAPGRGPANVKRDLNRWLPLVKWLLAIPPHYVVPWPS